MTGLLLATLLNLSPGIQLADNVQSRNVALSDARLPLQFVAYDEDGQRPSIDAMTRDQLAIELRRLDDTRPSLVGPIVLLSVGGALAIPGAVILVEGLQMISFSSSGYAIVGYLVAGVGVVFVVVGAILAIVGGINLAIRIASRRAHAEETNEVRSRIDTLDQTVPPPPPPPPGPDTMPPPPPPPPQANFVVPGGMQTVMTF